MWCYEVRVSDGRLAVLSSGFKTKRDAQDAGERARRMVDSICHPNLQGLTVVTEEYEPIFGSLSEMPFEPEESPNLQRLADAGPKYAWQQPVFDAFMEPHSDALPGKINAAERAISARLLDPTPVEMDERIAIREALQCLLKLLTQEVKPNEESDENKRTA